LLLWLTESPVVRLLSFFRLSQFAVMLLDHIGSFQQLVKSPLVENWFVLFVGHVFLRTCGRLRRQVTRSPESKPILVQFLHPEIYLRSWPSCGRPSTSVPAHSYERQPHGIQEVREDRRVELGE